MVRALVGDSTMTSRRRAGALLVATDASLVLLVFRMVLLLITLLSPDVPGWSRVLRWTPLRPGTDGTNPTHRGGASTVTPSRASALHRPQGAPVGRARCVTT